jgi:hypothetical protein
VPVVEIEHNGIGRRILPAMLAQHAGGADHADAPLVKTLSFF